MPRRKEQFENEEIYHIVIRRIGNELLFRNISDYYRGIFSIYEFNNSNAVSIRECRQSRKQHKKLLVSLPSVSLPSPGLGKLYQVQDSVNSVNFVNPKIIIDKRDKLIEVLTFCFMPNHIHLLLRQTKDNGISKFMNKFGSGYSRYFKEKYDLQVKGYFFQGKFEAIRIKNEDQLRTVFIYIHTNPISLIEPKWKEQGIKNPKRVIEFIENYKWSSYQDYIGKKNFPSIIENEKEYIMEIMEGEKGCRKNINDWVRYKGEIKEYSEIALE